MVEKNLIINNRTINYKGVFRADELLRTIGETLDKLNYEKQEKKTEEEVTTSGKNIRVELRPFKNKSSFASLMIKIKINMMGIVEVFKEVDGVKKKFQQGELELVFDAWSITDYAARWGMKPWFFFLKGFINKYFYRFPSEEVFVVEVKKDTAYLVEQIRSLLNLYKYQVGQEREKERSY